jgi:hypothetical protein
MLHIKLRVALTFALLFVVRAAIAQDDPLVHFQSDGVRLPGSQFQYDAGFDIVDWNHDGRPDIFLLATGTVGGNVAFNQGTLEQPRFGHATYWPFNATETEPQTIEHISSYTFCDLHNNGLGGIIFFDGQLRYCPNTGTKTAPFYWKMWREKPQDPKLFPGTDRFVKENARFSTGPESMYWKRGIFARQVLTLTAGDWDGDGLQDLIISRFKSEAPGVTDLGAHDPTYRRETWSAWGRARTALPTPAAVAATAEAAKLGDFSGPLKAAPERGLYFYKNVGTAEKPSFDAGVEIKTPAGESIAAPNPIVADVDGDGRLDIAYSETNYSCNAFRVDWPTAPHVQWFRRTTAAIDVLDAAQPLTAGGQPVRAGTMVRLADFRKAGVHDLLVMDPGGSIRWYANRAKTKTEPAKYDAAVTLRGKDFLRFEFMVQPTVVDWFGPGSRDLILHGCIDAHCKWALRRTALYRNIAKQPGDLAYEFVGYFNYRGDAAMVPVALEERHYEVYGSSLGVFNDDPAGRKRIMMSVGGKLYTFSEFAADGLTFDKMTPVEIPQVRNRHKGWQEVAIEHAEPIRYIKISNDANGQGNLRDSFLHVLQFEALSGGKNVATADAVEIKKLNEQKVIYYQVQNPKNMFTPGNANTDKELKATGWGYYIGPAVITLKEPVKLDKIRFQLSERDSYCYRSLAPFGWQGEIVRAGMEADENWYQYKVEVSADEKNWTLATNRLQTEMLTSRPLLVDWNKDGKTDLFLGVTTSNGIYPMHKTYRLYLNTGTNDAPKYAEPIFATDEKGKRLELTANWAMAYGAQCGVAIDDIFGDGKPAMLVEDFEGGLAWYRNVSPDSTSLMFKKSGKYAALNGKTIASRQYRYFHWGDVDGDRTADLIDSGFGTMAFYKGVAAAAPPRVEDLAVVKTDGDKVTVSWTRPPRSATFDLRWNGASFTEPAWNGLSGVSGTYRSAVGEKETAVLEKLPAGVEIRAAVRSLATDGTASGISEPAEAVVAPLARVVLRNGLSGVLGVPAYAGASAVDVYTSEAAGRPAPTPGVIEVRSQDATTLKGKEKVILLRFADLPALKNVERATLELIHEPEKSPTLMNTSEITCNSIGTAWDAATATTTQARSGLAWGKQELERGGTCRSFLEPKLTVQSRRRTWDVTEAVLEAVKNGKSEVSLLLRFDYTGHYVANQGLRFCSVDNKVVEDRPRLVVITRE